MAPAQRVHLTLERRSASASRRRSWCRLAAIIGAFLVVALGTTSAADADQTGDPATALADRYRPIVQVRSQGEECGSGEPFRPTTVESVLGRPDVVLRDANDNVVVTAPTAADLFGRPDGDYLDLPGDPLRPECTYEQWWREIEADLATSTYARVATDPDRPGKLVVQYWFWWIFNDWNDKHEGDWEMFQVVFDVGTPEEALATAPVQVVYAQHEGAQYRAWDDPGLQREGDRVMYYPGEGSHAGYDSANRWFGKSPSAGFGCDDTRAPHDRLDPEVVMLPAQPGDITEATDPLAWVTFEGRWGQREGSFNNGPQGPPLKESWTNPIRWVEDFGRPNAVAIPPLGTVSTNGFCGLASDASVAFVTFLDRPVALGAVVGAVVLVLVIAITRTRWRPTDPLPVRRRRGAGQIFAAAFRLQRRYAVTYAGLGGVVLAGGFVSYALAGVILDLTPAGDLADVASGGETSMWAVPIALLAGAMVAVPVTAWVLASTGALVDRLSRDEAIELGPILRQAARPSGPILIGILQLLLLSISTALVAPFVLGLALLARLPAAIPVAVHERLGVRASFRRSWALARGRGWHTFGVGLVAVATLSFLGLFVGGVVLLATGWPFGVVNVIAFVVGMGAVPWAGTVLALLAMDLVADDD